MPLAPNAAISRGIVIPRPDFAVDADLANAAGNQLRVLRAEIENQDLVGVDIGHEVAVNRGAGNRVWMIRRDACTGLRHKTEASLRAARSVMFARLLIP